MVAAVYARVSTEEQARHGFSLGEQLARCRARALELGAESVAEFVDDGVSGELWERPALSALRAQARAGALGLFVCLDPDRLARRLVHQLLATDELERCGVRIEFVDFEWRATAEGQLFAQLRGAIAEYEKAKIRARTALGRHGKALRGGLPHYTCPYGYSWRDGGLAVAPSEAAGVIAAYRWFVADPDLSYRGLARLMQDAFPPRRGSWDGASLRRILASTAYVGRMRVERYDAGGAHLNRHLPKDQRVPYRRPRPPGAGVDVAVPSIVEVGLWEAAQAKAARIRARRGKGGADGYLLSGLVRCGRCGRTMAGKTQRSAGRTYRYYACRAGCGAPQIRASDLEAAAWAAVAEAVVDAGALAAAVAEAPPAEDTVERALAAIGQEQERVWVAWRRGLVDAARFEAAVSELAGRRQRLRARAAPAERPAAVAPATVAALLEGLGPETRRRVVAEVVASVRIEPDRWRITLRV